MSTTTNAQQTTARAMELVATGLDMATAFLQASTEAETARQLEINAQIEQAKKEAQTKADEEAGNMLYCGVRCAGLRKDSAGNVVSPAACRQAVALEDGIGYEAASYAAANNGKSSAYYPPKVWIFCKNNSPFHLTQNECAGLLRLMKNHPAEMQKALETAGSPEAVAIYQAKRAEMTEAGLLTKRGK